MLHRNKYVFINACSFEVDADDLTILKMLAEQRKLDGTALKQASDDVIDAIYSWYKDGWLHLNTAK
jgi:50S ribosomal protein L16 3-hydroxylase